MFRLGQSINLTNYLEILLISELVVKGMRITCSVETKLTILLVMNNLLRPEAYLTFIGNNQVVDNCSESSVSLQR